jgi:AcrR family transcriptional regulator
MGEGVGRGESTRQRILEHAMAVASAEGFDGLTIGRLSADLGLSKSGLFAHFGSKEALQEALLDLTAARFTERVIRPALEAPRGLPRLEAVIERWLEWGRGSDMPGGCLLMAAGFEFDDRPGLIREVLVRHQRDAARHHRSGGAPLRRGGPPRPGDRSGAGRLRGPGPDFSPTTTPTACSETTRLTPASGSPFAACSPATAHASPELPTCFSAHPSLVSAQKKHERSLQN